MEQLLKITTVPVQYELKINNARLEYSRSNAQVEISRSDGEFTIKSRPVKLNLDTYEARNSVTPTLRQSISNAAQKGQEMAYRASATFAREGQLMLKAKIGEDVLNEIFRQRSQLPTGDFQLGFIPNAPVDIQYQAPDLTIRYEMDKLNFDLKMEQGNFKFIPGDIQLSITQQPDVLIEYIGGPLYVPPSADPNYEPIDVRA